MRVSVVHLQPTYPLTPEGINSAVAARLRQAEVIVASHEAAGSPTKSMILGDFNHLPGNEVYKLMLRHFVDAGRLADPDTTFQLGPIRTRIDYIWLTPDVEAASASVLNTDASDHDPLVAQLQNGTPSVVQR